MRVLLDTSAMIALVLQQDVHHRRAREFLRGRGLQLTTNSVLVAEYYTHLQRRFGFAKAISGYDQMHRLGTVTVFEWPADRDIATYDTLRTFAGVPLSYADASLITLGRELGIDTVFGFDSDFRLAGFTVLPD